MPLLDGIRVLDFGRFIAGPYCAALLSDHGADVVRIERPEGGEDRFVAPLAPGVEGGLYLQMNRNKRSLAIDPNHPDGRPLIVRLLRDADVVVANLPPETLRRMGLDYPTLSALNPRVVLVAATAYGPVGPLRDRVGFDSVGQAMSGAMYLSGTPQGPVRSVVNYVDFATATACAMGAIAALWARERTGRGQLVESSLLRSGVTIANALLIEQAVRKPDRVPQGSRGFSAAPVDLFRTRSGWITVQSVGQAMFDRWCELVGRPALRADPRFGDDESRGRHSAEISGIMSDWCAARERDRALDELAAARIPSAPVLTPQQVLDDSHVAAAAMLQPMGFPSLDVPFPLAPHPVDLSDTPADVRRPPPRLGEHSREVLEGIGLPAQQIAALIERGVVRQAAA
jgi:crotonobetainyl-CoA:carnitine CoA-transferase CaiB-like acyl-CoA transferase